LGVCGGWAIDYSKNFDDCSEGRWKRILEGLACVEKRNVVERKIQNGDLSILDTCRAQLAMSSSPPVT
jgi:hypothetical protein